VQDFVLKAQAQSFLLHWKYMSQFVGDWEMKSLFTIVFNEGQMRHMQVEGVQMIQKSWQRLPTGTFVLDILFMSAFKMP
jgi:hypothetical protein